MVDSWDAKAAFMRRVGATHAEWDGRQELMVLVLAPVPLTPEEPAEAPLDDGTRREEVRLHPQLRHGGSRLFRVTKPGDNV